MNHQDVRNQYLQVHGIDPVEIEVESLFGLEVETVSLEITGPTTIGGISPPPGSVFVAVSPASTVEFFVSDDEPRCNAATHGRRCSTCTCEDSRDE